MKKILIMTDSGSDLSLETAKEHGIHLIPFTVTIDEKVYTDRIELTTDMLYEAMKADKTPTTSQITFAQHYDEFKKFTDEYDILYIPISAKASGSYQSANLAANTLMEEDSNASVTIIENNTFSYGYGMLAIEASQMAQKGKSISEICEHIYSRLSAIDVVFAVEDLKYLQRGGRISAAAKIVGNVLDIKPILGIKDGLVVSTDKVRGSKKLISKMVSSIEDKLNKDSVYPIIIMHADNAETAETFKKAIIDATGIENFIVEELGATIGVHAGPGTFGAIFPIK